MGSDDICLAKVFLLGTAGATVILAILVSIFVVRDMPSIQAAKGDVTNCTVVKSVLMNDYCARTVQLCNKYWIATYYLHPTLNQTQEVMGHFEQRIYEDGSRYLTLKSGIDMSAYNATDPIDCYSAGGCRALLVRKGMSDASVSLVCGGLICLIFTVFFGLVVCIDHMRHRKNYTSI